MAQEVFNQIDEQSKLLKEINIYHRDIKPQNIIITQGYELKLTDFGLSEFALPGSEEGVFNIAGTRGFWSPEIEFSYKAKQQVAKCNLWKSDQYSISIIGKMLSINKYVENYYKIENEDYCMLSFPKFWIEKNFQKLMENNSSVDVGFALETIDPGAVATLTQIELEQTDKQKNFLRYLLLKLRNLYNEDKMALEELLKEVETFDFPKLEKDDKNLEIILVTWNIDLYIESTQDSLYFSFPDHAIFQLCWRLGCYNLNEGHSDIASSCFDRCINMVLKQYGSYSCEIEKTVEVATRNFLLSKRPGYQQFMIKYSLWKLKIICESESSKQEEYFEIALWFLECNEDDKALEYLQLSVDNSPESLNHEGERYYHFALTFK